MTFTTTILLLISNTFMYSTPFIFGALSGVLSEKVGVTNLGIEGVMNIGAITGVIIASKTGNPWIGFIGAGLSGSFVMLFHAIASVSLKGDQTISGIALNFIGPGLALFLCRLFFNGSVMSDTVKTLPRILDPIIKRYKIPSGSLLTYLNFDSTFILAILFTIIIWFFMYKTKYGLRLIAVGEQPAAADSLGVNVSLVRYITVILSGAFAGMAGAACTLRIISSFSPTIIAGKGFIAIAAVIFGKWTPHGAFFACLLFGLAQGLVIIIGGSDIQISNHLISMLPYVLTIVVLIMFVGRASSPSALGEHFEKGKR